MTAEAVGSQAHAFLIREREERDDLAFAQTCRRPRSHAGRGSRGGKVNGAVDHSLDPVDEEIFVGHGHAEGNGVADFKPVISFCSLTVNGIVIEGMKPGISSCWISTVLRSGAKPRTMPRTS